MTLLLEFSPELLRDKDRSRAERRYRTKTRHQKHGHYRESRDRRSVDPAHWSRRLLIARLKAVEEPLLQMEMLELEREELEQQRAEMDAWFADDYLEELYCQVGLGPSPRRQSEEDAAWEEYLSSRSDLFWDEYHERSAPMYY